MPMKPQQIKCKSPTILFTPPRYTHHMQVHNMSGYYYNKIYYHTQILISLVL